ncbi:MAG: hypothetical protein WAO28_01785 [Candidatus Microsaccharimonas sp.]
MTTKIFRIVLCISILLNIFDIVLHIAINQPEILRITGNVLIIAASGVALQRQRSNLVLIIGLVAYLILNGVFIALNGIGTAGMAFVTLTTVFTVLSLFLRKIK